MVFADLNKFSCKENKKNKITKKFDNVRFSVRPLCELQLFAALDTNDICKCIFFTSLANPAISLSCLCKTKGVYSAFVEEPASLVR